jgi:hypothetical protein
MRHQHKGSAITMKRPLRLQATSGFATLLTVAALLLSGCGDSKTPPRAYVAAPIGASSAEELVEKLKRAYTARDADAAMKLFYWQPGAPQDYWWATLPEMFAAGYDKMELVENASNSDDPSQKTTLPVIFKLRITTTESPTRIGKRTLGIGKTENGFYFTPPITE